MRVLDMARELIDIEQDIKRRVRHADIDDFYIYDFDQVWGSTALGFPGMGGAAMTTARTYVLVPTTGEHKAYVYFAGQFAYTCPITGAFCEDLNNERMASVMESSKYIDFREVKNDKS